MKKLFIPLLFMVSSLTFAQTKGQTENVILITLDGYRWQELFKGADSVLIRDKTYVEDTAELKKMFWERDINTRREKLMPFFWQTIAKQGQLYGNRAFDNKVNVSNKMWFSYHGYNEILSGFADDARIHSNEKIKNPNQTVLEYLNKQPDLKGKVAAFGSWDVFPFIINTERSGIPVNAGFDIAKGNNLTEMEKALNTLQSQVPIIFGGVRMDAFTHHYAMEYLKKNKPKVLYISYGETDDFAHEGKFDSYLRSAHQTDAFIKEIWDWTQSDAQYKNKTTLIITTDHGRGDIIKENWKHHGDKISDADQIWMAFLGPDTKPLGEVQKEGQLYQNQVAASVAALLGKDYKNEKPVGKPIADAIGKKMSSVSGK
jgi:hypothetical protein